MLPVALEQGTAVSLVRGASITHENPLPTGSLDSRACTILHCALECPVIDGMKSPLELRIGWSVGVSNLAANVRKAQRLEVLPVGLLNLLLPGDDRLGDLARLAKAVRNPEMVTLVPVRALQRVALARCRVSRPYS